jgi:hypothetical protein
MRMPSFTAVHVHLQSRTVSYRRFTIALVTPSMDGTTPVCCSTSPTRRWISVPTESSTLSTTWRSWMMASNLEQQLLELQVQAPPEPADPEEIDAMSGVAED